MRNRASNSLLGATLLSLLFAGVEQVQAQADFQGATHLVAYEEEPIQYGKRSSTGPVAMLENKLQKGEVKLEWDEKFGFLPSILKELDIPASSQMLVFSKSSLQRDHISPSNPRAIFFNDKVYIGYIPGAPVIEISEVDSTMGGVFYKIDQSKTVPRPKLERTDQCLECHASAKSMGVPGHFVRSFHTDENGSVDLFGGGQTVNHRTPIEERWGGWYVTGESGSQSHLGNLIGKAAYARHKNDPALGKNITEVSNFFDASKYLAASSDIVALMVMEHQIHMHNFLARLQYESSLALAQYGHINYLNTKVEAFLRYLLFTEEAPIKAPLKGNSTFSSEFVKAGPFDSKGRSLRQLDLDNQLFAYPCSYLIYSEAFDKLPAPLKDKIYARLFDILTNKDTSDAFIELDRKKNREIFEILVETKKDLPSSWRDWNENHLKQTAATTSSEIPKS
ncbi:MAG: hypothetical protein ACO1QB_13215 [Verrucomicrobiales bacterium]